MSRTRAGALLAAAGGLVVCALFAAPANAADIQWADRSWKVTSGPMAGVAAGSPGNVSVDQNGYLHLAITNSGGTWTAAEIFSQDKFGFGTYQWQVDGPIDRFDANVVLGLFPYGPDANIGADGTNEIDIEYSFWGHPGGPNGDFTDYPASGTTIGEKSYTFTLGGGTFSTSRILWGSKTIVSSLLSGFQPITSTAGVLQSWTYAPANPATNIPQQALPLGINLWCFDAPPSDGKNVEVVIRDFQFQPAGTDPSNGAAGSAGNGGAGSGGTSGTSPGGANAVGGASTSNGGTSNGGTSNGGTSNGGTSNGGTSNSGTSNSGTSNSGTSNGGSSNAAMPSSGGAAGVGATRSTGPSTAGNGGSLAPSGAAGASDGGSTNPGGCGCRLSGKRPVMPCGVALLLLSGLALRRRSRPKA